jgi:hypothetical protein
MMLRLVLRLCPFGSGCALADDTLLEGACGVVAMVSAAPPTSPASGSNDEMGNKPTFCWCITSNKAYE